MDGHRQQQRPAEEGVQEKPAGGVEESPPPGHRPETPVGAAHQEAPHGAALLLVGSQEAPGSGAPEHQSDLPSQVVRVLQPGVHTQAADGGVNVGSVTGDEDPTSPAAVPPSEAGVQFIGREPRRVGELELGPERLPGHLFELRQLRRLWRSVLVADRVHPPGAHEAVPAFLGHREHEQDPAAPLQHEVDPPV